MKPLVLFVGTIFLLAKANIGHAVVISDGDFSNWTFSSFHAGTAAATVTREPSGGNPGARLNITTVTNVTDAAFGTAIKDDFSTNAPLSGPFTLSLDVLSGPGGFGQGQAIELLVEQGGTVYGASLGVTGWPFNTFTTISFNGTFDPTMFTRVIGAGPLTPDFSGGVTTHFGFAGGNLKSNTLTQYYDNFSLDVPGLETPANAPVMSGAALVALAMMIALIGVRAVVRRSHH